MLATLLESRGRSPRRRVAMTASVVAHSVLLIVLVMARARGSSADGADDPLPTNIVYIAPEQQQPPRETWSTHPVDRSLRPPLDIAPVMVDADAIADVMPHVGPVGPILPAFPRGPFARADTAARAAGDLGDLLTSLAVDHQVEILPGQRPPRYPVALERAGIAGDVTVQFIVDTTGRVERGSLTILAATHPDFARAVQESLPALRFVPALARGRVVRQLVEQRFHFELVRR